MTQRLPIPGSDDGTWGSILNGFLEVSLNADGTLATAALTAAGGVTSINGQTPSSGAVTLTAANISALPTSTKLSGLADTSSATSATNGQVLAFNSTSNQWIPSTVSSTTVNNATTGAPGLVQLAGDLGGTSTSATAPTLAATTNVENIITGNTTVAGAAQKSNNLSDLTSASTARTNLGLGSAATISSTAGGDLSGTLPSPTVAKVNGVTVTGTPSNGQVITATSGTAANWQTLSGGSPTGSASGDLSGSYPGPTVAKVNGITVTGTPSTGQVITATSGTAANWQTPPSGSSSTLSGDTDVTITSPANNQVLTYNTSAGKWENIAPAVPSVFGRTGAVTATTGDYTAAQVTGALVNTNNLSDVSSASTARTNLGLGSAALISSTAGGDLSGTLPSPTVAKVNGVTVTGTPSSGQVITATSSSTASWSAPTGGAPSGSAGGDLSGSYPNPGVAKINGVAVTGTPSANQIPLAGSSTTAAWTSLETSIKSFNIISQSDEVVIAPSNSTAWANYYCTGNITTGGDEIIINSAIASLSVGGKVRLLAGNFYRTNPIVGDIDHLTIEGQGKDATIISPAANAVGAADMIIGNSRQPTGTTLRDFSFSDDSNGIAVPYSSSACGLIFRANGGVVEHLNSQGTALDGFRFEGYKNIGSTAATLSVTVSTTPSPSTQETWTFSSTSGLTANDYYFVMPPSGTNYFPEWVQCNTVLNGTTATISRTLGTTAAQTHASGSTLLPFTISDIFELTALDVEPVFSNRDGIVIDPGVFNSELIACRVEGGNGGVTPVTRNGFWVAGGGIKLIACHPYFCSSIGAQLYSTLATGAEVYIMGGEYETCPTGIVATDCSNFYMTAGTTLYANTTNDINAGGCQRVELGDFTATSSTSGNHIFIGGAAQSINIHDFRITNGSQGISCNSGNTGSTTNYSGQIHDGTISGTSGQSIVLENVCSVNAHHLDVTGELLETGAEANYNRFADNVLHGSASVSIAGAQSVNLNNLTGAP